MNQETQKKFLVVSKNLVEHPFSKICVHHVALEILGVMDEAGVDVPEELYSSLVTASAGDERSQELLAEMIEEVSGEEEGEDDLAEGAER